MNIPRGNGDTTNTNKGGRDKKRYVNLLSRGTTKQRVERGREIRKEEKERWREADKERERNSALYREYEGKKWQPKSNKIRYSTANTVRDQCGRVS